MSTIVSQNYDLFVARDYAALCEEVAGRIADLVRKKPNAVLGLATGATPLGVYDILVSMAERGNVDFSKVTCFNLDEYFPMDPSSPHSYYRFMWEHLFSGLTCRAWHVPDGSSRSRAEIAFDCQVYEEKIKQAGGIDLQLLGIGRTGHIGFNEPGSARDSRTRLVVLDEITREDAAAEFGGIENVPPYAVTMGIGTILESREILLIASGARKAQIVNRALTAEIGEDIPATLLRLHPNVTFCVDAAATI